MLRSKQQHALFPVLISVPRVGRCLLGPEISGSSTKNYAYCCNPDKDLTYLPHPPEVDS
jgi:hypothetical protein